MFAFSDLAIIIIVFAFIAILLILLQILQLLKNKATVIDIEQKFREQDKKRESEMGHINKNLDQVIKKMEKYSGEETRWYG
jgi:hypothetical protein